VVQQRRGSGVTGELAVVGHELVGQFRGAEPFQVHREEGHVVEHVDVAQVVVELQAVQHPRAVVEAEDVVGE